MRTTLVFGFSFYVALALGQDADSLAAAAQVDSLIKVSRDFTAKGAYDEALKVNAAAEKIVLEKLGRESAAYGSCCFNRGEVLEYKGDNAESEKWYLEAKAIREKVLGKKHLDYAHSLFNLALLYSNTGQYKKSEPLYLEAKAIWEQVLGKEHPNYAVSLNNLANLYWEMGSYEKAEPLHLEALAVRGKVLGKEHPDYGASLNNLATLYSDMGNYEKSEVLYLEAKAIREKVLGEEHPDYALLLNNLATLYQDMGNYEKAEMLFLEAKTIREKGLGKEHPDYGASLNNLATLYSNMGNYEKSEVLYLEAKAIWGKGLGKEHPYYSLILNNLAHLYSDMGAYDKAEPLFLEAKAIWEKVLGKEHPDYALSLNSLANLYWEMGAYEKARPFYLEAKAICEQVLGKEHPDYALLLNNLANLYREMGAYEKAKPFYLEAKAICEQVQGKEHPDYALVLNNLANLYRAIGTYEKAEPIFAELSSVNQSLLEKSARHLSERELDSYLTVFSERQDRALSFAQMSGPAQYSLGEGGNKKVVPTCYDNILFYKGFLLNAANRVKRLAYSDSTATEKYNLLKSYGRRLAAEYAKPITDRDSASVAELEEKSNTLEKDLARTVAGYGEASRQVNWRDVQEALKPGVAAVEFVHYRFFEKKETDSTMYAALLLGSGDQQPLFIPLFEEKQLATMLQSPEKGQIAALYAVRGAKPVVRTGLANLYELVWKPLEPHLENVEKIFFSPSGMLHRLNFGAMPLPEKNKTLSDKFHLVELGSTRQLVVPTTLNPAANDAVLFGGIAYDSDSSAMSQANAALDSISIASRGELSFAYTDSTLRIGTWSALPYTDREVSSVEKTLKAAGFQSDTRRGFAATEEAFKAIGNSHGVTSSHPVTGSPRVLHIATHGFFFPDPAADRRPSTVDREPVFKLSDHPMIRSGLILAGGNHAWATGKPLRPGMEDGILTAYEISQMNLSNTELVVLSACETGLGDISGNEGVYGLQRAFKIAGAKYLIMSLWQVPDKQTSLLMTTFYKKWLEEKMEIPEAFRAAQKELREAGLDPYYWAGFVLVE